PCGVDWRCEDRELGCARAWRVSHDRNGRRMPALIAAAAATMRLRHTLVFTYFSKPLRARVISRDCDRDQRSAGRLSRQNNDLRRAGAPRSRSALATRLIWPEIQWR